MTPGVFSSATEIAADMDSWQNIDLPYVPAYIERLEVSAEGGTAVTLESELCWSPEYPRVLPGHTGRVYRSRVGSVDQLGGSVVCTSESGEGCEEVYGMVAGGVERAMAVVRVKDRGREGSGYSMLLGEAGDGVCEEHGVPLKVSLGLGYSTNVYLDTSRVRRYLLGIDDGGKSVCNLFAHTGAMTKGWTGPGVAVDLKRPVENVGELEGIKADCFEYLKGGRER